MFKDLFSQALGWATLLLGTFLRLKFLCFKHTRKEVNAWIWSLDLASGCKESVFFSWYNAAPWKVPQFRSSHSNGHFQVWMLSVSCSKVTEQGMKNNKEGMLMSYCCVDCHSNQTQTQFHFSDSRTVQTELKNLPELVMKWDLTLPIKHN